MLYMFRINWLLEHILLQNMIKFWLSILEGGLTPLHHIMNTSHCDGVAYFSSSYNRVSWCGMIFYDVYNMTTNRQDSVRDKQRIDTSYNNVHILFTEVCILSGSLGSQLVAAIHIFSRPLDQSRIMHETICLPMYDREMVEHMNTFRSNISTQLGS